MRTWPTRPSDLPFALWVVLVLLSAFALLPIAIRVYGAYWALIMGAGAFLEFWLPRVG